jgi:hypothetical protein
MTEQFPQETTSAWGCFLRTYWMLFGPALVLMSLAIAVLYWKGWFGVPDAVFATVLGLCIGARWLDDPKSLPSRRRYALGALACGVVIWFAARLLRTIAAS